jgi:hypothetical protein
MKRKELIKQLNKLAKNKKYDLEYKEGGNHTKVFINNLYFMALPRHKEIKENLAKAIITALKKKK